MARIGSDLPSRGPFLPLLLPPRATLDPPLNFPDVNPCQIWILGSRLWDLNPGPMLYEKSPSSKPRTSKANPLNFKSLTIHKELQVSQDQAILLSGFA
jgi:hypothetical protein